MRSLLSVCAVMTWGCTSAVPAPRRATDSQPFTAQPAPPPLITPAPPAAPGPDPVAASHKTHHGEPRTLQSIARGAVKLPGLGEVKRAVSTRDAEAQAYFDQGLALTYGFNHDEAARSFAHAAELDPTCAMCLWGAAYTLGPNYNIPMLPDRAAAAWEAINAAEAVAADTSPVERALIGALKQRYAGPSWIDPVAMVPYNVAYANAMRKVAKAYPEDHDVQVLFAEALMNVDPWRLWSPTGRPAKGTLETVRTLERVLAKQPTHAGANHYYIHAVEASPRPARALPSADRLASLMPGAGHIVHMPAHIYQRVGRYAEASEANRRAAAVDEAYLRDVKAPGYYAFYTGHNYGFLAYSASMQGRSAEAIAAARKSAAQIPADIVCGMPGMDFFLSEPLLVLVRFGRFAELLAEPEPSAKYPTLVALWQHARSMALASTGKLDDARGAVLRIREIAGSLPADQLAGLSTGRAVLALAAKVLEARVAEAAHEPGALALWEEAVRMEDALAYSEPADWFYPTRHFLGAALLGAGQAKKAEAVYRADLVRNPNNGWALYGLAQAMAAQNKPKDVELQRAFEAAWKDADITLERSAF